jgi:hypothetical protein
LSTLALWAVLLGGATVSSKSKTHFLKAPLLQHSLTDQDSLSLSLLSCQWLYSLQTPNRVPQKLTPGQAVRQQEGDLELIAALEHISIKRKKDKDELSLKLLREQVSTTQVRNVLHADQVCLANVEDWNDALFDRNAELAARLVQVQSQDDDLPVLPPSPSAEDQVDKVGAADQSKDEHNASLENGALGGEVYDGLLLAERAGWWGVLAVGGILFIYRTWQ